MQTAAHQSATATKVVFILGQITLGKRLSLTRHDVVQVQVQVFIDTLAA